MIRGDGRQARPENFGAGDLDRAAHEQVIDTRERKGGKPSVARPAAGIEALAIAKLRRDPAQRLRARRPFGGRV